jgi:hypothetical protein
VEIFVRKLAALLVVSGLLLMVGTSQVIAAGQCPTHAIHVDAFADYNSNPLFPLHGTPDSIWVDSGLMLALGLPVTVTATDTSFAYADFPVGPNGTGGSCPAFCGGPGLPFYSLIARIGNGPPFFVGAGPTVVSGEGELSFAFNDGLYDDNSGFFTATLSYGC